MKWFANSPAPMCSKIHASPCSVQVHQLDPSRIDQHQSNEDMTWRQVSRIGRPRCSSHLKATLHHRHRCNRNFQGTSCRYQRLVRQLCIGSQWHRESQHLFHTQTELIDTCLVWTTQLSLSIVWVQKVHQSTLAALNNRLSSVSHDRENWGFELFQAVKCLSSLCARCNFRWACRLHFSEKRKDFEFISGFFAGEIYSVYLPNKTNRFDRKECLARWSPQSCPLFPSTPCRLHSLQIKVLWLTLRSPTLVGIHWVPTRPSSSSHTPCAVPEPMHRQQQCSVV